MDSCGDGLESDEEYCKEFLQNENVLQRVTLDCISLDTKKAMDDDGADLVFHIARILKLKLYVFICIEVAKTGGGKPHEAFLRYLVHPNSNISIVDVSNALASLEMHDARNVWDEISKDKEKICEVDEVYRMNHFLHNLSHTTRSWVDVAYKLGRGNLVENFKRVKPMGGQYSPAEELFKHLNKAAINFQQLVQSLITIDENDLLPNCMNILMKFAKDIKKELGIRHVPQEVRNSKVNKEDTRSRKGANSEATSFQTWKDEANDGVQMELASTEMRGAVLASPLDVTNKLVQRTKLKLNFSLKAVKTEYRFKFVPLKKSSILSIDDCDLNSSLFRSIKQKISDTFALYLENSIGIVTNRYNIHFPPPVFVKSANYLLFDITVMMKDGTSIPETYYLDSTPESEHLWDLLEQAIKKASELEACDVKVGLKSWEVGSISITVSLTKEIKCSWKDEEVSTIRERIQHYSAEMNLPDNLHVVSVEPHSYLQFNIEIMCYDEVIANAVSSFLYDFEESLVGNVVNGSATAQRGTCSTTKTLGSVDKKLEMDIDNVTIRQADVVHTEDENVQVAYPEGISHACIDQSGQLTVLVHNEQNVREFLFQDKISYQNVKIELLIGGNKCIRTYQEWLIFCKLRYGRKDKKIKLLQGSEIILRTPDSWKGKLADLLRKQFDDRIFMTDGYEIIECFKFLGHTPSEISCRDYQNYSAVFKHFEHILIFLPAARIMLLMLIVDVDKTKTPYVALNQGLSSLPCAAKRYIEIHHKHFREGEISLITSIVVPGMQSSEIDSLNTRTTKEEKNDSAKRYIEIQHTHFREGEISLITSIVVPGMQSSEIDSLNTRTTKEEKKDSECCTTCKDKYILCENHLNDQGEFQKWWDKLCEGREKNISSKNMDADDVHEEFIVQIKAFIDTRAIWTADKSTLSKWILLNELQKKVLMEGPLKVIIHGAYGSGKTFLLQLRLKQLTQSLKNNDTIFFLTYNSQSLLLQYMKDYVESLPKETWKATIHVMDFKELSNHFGIPNITLTKFFEQISKSPGNHAIIDELSPIEIPRDDIGKINSILTSPNLEKSSIWIAVVPVARTRKIGEEVLVQEEDTEIFTAIKPVTLDTTFRCSDEIHKLVKITVEVIENHPSKFPYSRAGIALSSHVAKQEENKKLNESQMQTTKDQSQELVAVKHTKQENEAIDINEQENDMQSTDEQQGKVPSVGDVMDKLMKDTCGRNKGKSKEYLETNFKFLKSESCDVSQVSCLLISPFPDYQCADMEKFEKTFRAHIALETTKISTGKIAIICTNLSEYQVFVQALSLAREVDERQCKYNIISYLPTLAGDQNIRSSQAKEIYEKLSQLSNYVLLTDINGIMGLEFYKVILPVTPSEEFQSYALVSSITRCQYELILLKFPWFDTTDNPITAEVIKAWKKSKVVAERIIEFDETCECVDDSLKSTYHIHPGAPEDEVERFYAHPHQKLYDFYEKINDFYEVSSLDTAPEYAGKRVTAYQFLEKCIEKYSSRDTTRSDTTTRFRHAKSLYALHEYKKAMSEFRTVYEEQVQILGVNHRDTLATQFWHAKSLYAEHEYENAKSEFRTVYEQRVRILGVNDEYTISTLYWHAICLNQLQQYKLSKQELEHVYEQRSKDLGTDHDKTVSTLYWMARCDYALGLFIRSKEGFEKVHQKCFKLFGETHEKAIGAKCWFAKSLYRLEEYKDAQQIFESVYEVQKEWIGLDDPESVNTLLWVNKCIEKQYPEWDVQ